MSELKKGCLECGKPIFGRSDKKFCSDGCRNAHHNKANASSNNFIRNVNSILGKNRRILLELNPSGKLETHRDQLLKKGFDFDYFTSSYKTNAGSLYFFCYEQGYLPLGEGRILLVARQEEIP